MMSRSERYSQMLVQTSPDRRCNGLPGDTAIVDMMTSVPETSVIRRWQPLIDNLTTRSVPARRVALPS